MEFAELKEAAAAPNLPAPVSVNNNNSNSSHGAPHTICNLSSRSVLKEINAIDCQKLSPMATKMKQQQQTSTGLRASLPNAAAPAVPTAAVAVGGAARESRSLGGSSCGGIFEANSTLNKFPIDPEFDAGHIDGVDIDAGVHGNTKKFTGLSEFDESEIPDLPLGLETDLEAHLKDDLLTCLKTVNDNKLSSTAILPNKLINTLINESETDCNSDSELFVECQSLNSDKCNTEQSDLDTYRSALNLDFSEEQVINKTLENVANNVAVDCQESNVPAAPLTPKANASNMSCDYEPMDVDMNVTMEMHTLLTEQQQQKITTPIKELPFVLTQPTLSVEGVKDKMVLNVDTVLPDTSKMLPILNNNEEKKLENTPSDTFSGYATPHEDITIEATQQNVETLAQTQVQPNDEEKSNKNTINDDKTVELFTYKDIRESTTATEDDGRTNLTLDMTGSFNSMKSTSTRLKSPISSAAAETANASTTKASDVIANLTLDMTASFGSVTSMGNSSIKSPSSPTFPIKNIENSGMFPRSPRAPPEKEQMPFLESCVMPTATPPEPNDISIKAAESTAAPILPTIQVLTPSPQKSPPAAQLNETVSMSNECSPKEHVEETTAMLNGTFNSGTEGKHFVAAELNKDDIKQRRTFSISTLDNEAANGGEHFPNAKENSRRTFSLPETYEKRRTFAIVTEEEKSPNSAANVTIDYGAAGDGVDLAIINTMPQRTYNLPNEAEHEPEPEPMECDEPMEIDETLQIQNQTTNVPTSPPIPTHQKQHQHVEEMNSPCSQRSTSPPLPTQQQQQSQRSTSPPLPTHQHNNRSEQQQYEETRSISPPLPTHQHERLAGEMASNERSNSPPLPTHRPKSDDIAEQPTPQLSQRSMSPPLPTHQKRVQEEAAGLDTTTCMSSSVTDAVLKRPSIHQSEACPNATIVLEDSKLSAKERAKSNAKDEKDIFVERFSSASPLDDIFAASKATHRSKVPDPDVKSNSDEDQFYDIEFQSNNNIILNPSDFDYLLTKGNNNVHVDRSSLLLKFDPLLGVPVPLNQSAQQQLQQQRSQDQLQIFGNNSRALSPTIEVNENSFSEEQHHLESKRERIVSAKSKESGEFKLPPPVDRSKKHAKMSVDVIDNDCNKTFENSNSQSEEKHLTYNKMDELEKKIKNEVLKTEDVEKKLKDAEQREETFIKRITEKDKTITKLSGVVEAYEKAIAELVTEKELMSQNYERQLNEVKADRDSNYHHLTSLETTFSDLHVKYEKSKEMTCRLKAIEETVIAEKRQLLDNLRLQEQRYDKMKNHAMQQLEIANKKLETVTKEHAIESTKLKALLKKEEVSRASITEQLQQKTRENAELVKICDELINGQGS